MDDKSGECHLLMRPKNSEKGASRFLPQVVAAYPGRPKSILLVAPMNEAMSTHHEVGSSVSLVMLVNDGCEE